MVLIFSNINDHSTNVVSQGLQMKNIPFIRINYLSELCGVAIDISSKNGCPVLLFGVDLKQEVGAVWYRREPENDLSEKFDNNKEANPNVQDIIFLELRVIKRYIYSVLKDKYWLNHPDLSNLNKLTVLVEAAALGLKIPETLVSSHPKEIGRFLLDMGNLIITKPLFEVRTIKEGGNRYLSRTSRVTIEVLNSLGDKIFPSLVQREVLKKFEVRVVYLEGNFYSMAIMSQNHEKTMTDFRFYDINFPNRYTAFELSLDIKSKLSSLMHVLGLNFGSIDLMVDDMGEFYFLEINPVGQFGMTSTPNNFGIEEKIVEILSKSHE